MTIFSYVTAYVLLRMLVDEELRVNLTPPPNALLSLLCSPTPDPQPSSSLLPIGFCFRVEHHLLVSSFSSWFVLFGFHNHFLQVLKSSYIYIYSYGKRNGTLLLFSSRFNGFSFHYYYLLQQLEHSFAQPWKSLQNGRFSKQLRGDKGFFIVHKMSNKLGWYSDFCLSHEGVKKNILVPVGIQKRGWIVFLGNVR